MANNEDKLSRLYREGLENFAKDPPPQVWTGIKQGLLIKNLVTLKFLTSLNMYSVTVLVAAAAIAGIIVGKQLQQKDNVNNTNKTASTIVTGIPSKTNEIKAEQNINYEKAVKVSATNAKNDGKIQMQPTNAITKKNVTVKKQESPVYKQQRNESLQNNENIDKLADPSIEKSVKTAHDQKTDNPEPSVLPEQQTKKYIQPVDSQNSAPEQSKKQSEQGKEISIPKKPKKGQGFYAEIFGAPSFVVYKFEQSTINPNLTFVEANKQDDMPALSYTAGLELGYGLKNIFAQTGINYSDYRSKALIGIIKTEIYSTYEYTKDSVWWYKDSMGKNYYHYTYDTIENRTTKDTTISYSSTNSMRYIEIPVLIGYRFYGKRITCAIIGGISFGYLTSSGGQILNPDLKSISVNTKEAIPYKPWTYYLILRAEAAYLLNNNLSVFIRPGFKYNMNSVFEDYYPVQKSFYAIDLHFGLRYNF